MSRHVACPPAHQHITLHGLQYKFVVDGEWKYAPDQAAMYDEGGNVNNVLEVQEYVPENLDSLSGFDPPPSPPSRLVPHGRNSPATHVSALMIHVSMRALAQHAQHAEAAGARTSASMRAAGSTQQSIPVS